MHPKEFIKFAKKQPMSQDLYGKALLAYHTGAYTEDITTYMEIAGEEEIDSLPLPYLFRAFDDMPSLEQKALKLATGKILDIGAGAGSHSLYLQEQNKEVTAVDVSKGAIEVCKARGVQNVINTNILQLKNQKYDTLLALMNGTGLAGKLNRLAPFLNHLKSFLNLGGQLLIDSSDIIYMYEDETGDHWIPADSKYYGEVSFQMEFQNEKEPPFDWLYVDFNTLKRCADFNGFDCALVLEGNHYDYLAKLTLKK